MKIIEKEKLSDFLPEEEQAQAIVEIKNILAKALPPKTAQPEENGLEIVSGKMDDLIEVMKEDKNVQWRHEVYRDEQGRVTHLISSPIRVRLKINK